MKTIIGITGGIASGKSTVTAFLRQQGYAVIDADQLVHDLQRKGEGLYQVLLAEFGPEILLENEELNRPLLSKVVFSNKAVLGRINQLQQAIIREELAQRLEEEKKRGQLFFMDLPLLYELGYEAWFDEVWLVYVDAKTQLGRLMERNGLSQLEAQKRLESQLSLEEKKLRADVLIDNRGSRQELFSQLEDLLEERMRTCE